MDKDLELKIRLNNILYSLGYYTRLAVKLAEYSLERGQPMELTDLDVLGIKIHPDLTFNWVVADCTSRREVIKSPIQRVFWLKGVMDFFNASRGYLALSTTNRVPESQRVVASKLGITILNEENLSNLERRVLNEHIPKLKLAEAASWNYFEGNLTTLAKDISFLLDFRKHHYWMNKSHQNLHALVSVLSKRGSSLDSKNPLHRALILDLLTLFSLSLLQMSSFVLQTNPENPKQELRVYFYGGYKELEIRESITQNIRKVLGEALPKQGYMFEQNLKLDPDYLPQLFDLAYRLVNKPADASQIPRYLQMVLFERALYQQKNIDGVKYLDQNFTDVTKKLTRDMASLFLHATRLSEKMLEEVFD
mgnify:CR=1 FL=1